MLCQRCITCIKAAYKLSLAIPEDTSRLTQYTGDDPLPIDNLYLSVVEGCWICRQLWVSMLKGEDDVTEYESDFSEQDGNSAEHEDRFATEFKILKSRTRRDSSIQFEMKSREDNLLRLSVWHHAELEFIFKPTPTNEEIVDAYMGPDIAGGSSSATGNPGLWRHWLRTCSSSHEKCRALDHKVQSFTPDRLVEIFTTDDGNTFTWRLVCRADIGNVQYLSLSHCWGTSGHTSLTSKNYSAFAKLTTYSGLPKSFQDAFYIAFSLGYRFIWIDSLCIVQDDPKDWKAQASKMGLVYKNACCNIAATWAKDGNGGCFTTGGSRMITLDLELGQSTRYQLSSALLYYDDNTDAPLNTRGWVAQERFLARRQLSFAKSQVYWECRELIASEQFPAGIPEFLRDFTIFDQAAPPHGKPTLDYTTEEDRRRAWAALVDFYSRCDFSRLSDRMVALAGLAEEMRHATGEIYLAGLWQKDLHRQLCWRTEFNWSMTPTYLAPTWSWASVNGPVGSDIAYELADMKLSYCIEILDASVLSEHVSGLHSFVGSSLVLRGIALWARAIETDRLSGWELQFTDLNDISHCMMSIDASIYWDEKMSTSEENPERWPSFLEERNSNLLCMFVSLDIRDSYVRGLLLRRLPSATDEVSYVRMGYFTEQQGALADLLSVSPNYPIDSPIAEDIDLDAAGLAELVHTVTIV